MFTWIAACFFLLFVGIGLGGVFISKRMMPNQMLFFLVAILFGMAGYLGMISGSLITHWLSPRIGEIIVAIICLAFIALCIVRFHPTLGFFHSEDKTLWGVLILLFFIIGVEWALLEMSRLFLLVAVLLLLGAIIGGAILQLEFVKKMWRIPFLPFFPLVWLLLVVVLKFV
ncbi:hypothetical protein [Bacillus sp. FJAT-45350]|uniref:hypothetical protein n=1 Tax=Bacillus sp. FJAT-45350 TaxID=2011014 RepID=UPI000BB852A1|nr:hypothetical protein [Bacillus sp. FJAT-45350]